MGAASDTAQQDNARVLNVSLFTHKVLLSNPVLVNTFHYSTAII